MVGTSVRRVVSAALLFVIGFGGGGLPILDGLFFHGPDRLAESFRPHYEASSTSCHADGCSVRSPVQSRVVGEGAAAPRVIVPFAQVVEFEPDTPMAGVQISFSYLSRAPPSA